MSRLGDTWSVLVVYMIADTSIRFTDLKRKVMQHRPISSPMLTRTLKQLERDGFIWRKVYPVIPPHVEYGLTELGHGFWGVARKVVEWAREYHEALDTAQREFDAQARDG